MFVHSDRRVFSTARKIGPRLRVGSRARMRDFEERSALNIARLNRQNANLLHKSVQKAINDYMMISEFYQQKLTSPRSTEESCV